jgi:hypothetical protein
MFETTSLAADIICSNNLGHSLVIDCTIAVPTAEKIDKILNTSKYLRSHTGKRFIPIVLTNKLAPNETEQAKQNGVVIMDKNDIDEVLKLIMCNNVEQAIELFLKKSTIAG